MFGRRLWAAPGLVLIATVAYSFGPGPASMRFEFYQAHMGTLFKIVLYAPNAENATRASDAAFERIEQLDATMSDYRETSELMSLCRQAGGRWIRVSKDLFRCMARSQGFAERTQGAFDITVGPLVRLWRRARRTGEMPDRQRLAQALDLTGHTKLRLDNKTSSVWIEKPGMLLDLGGIAKGYAADQAIALLKQQGISSALVAAGGDIVVSGPPPGTSGWTVSVAPLEASGKSPTACLVLRDAGISTSGDLEQHVEIGGVRYSHIIDPRTGLGVTGRNSVTVVASDGTTSDAMATAVCVLGPQAGLKVVDSSTDSAALFVQAAEHGLRVFESRRWRSIPKAGILPTNAAITTENRR